MFWIITHCSMEKLPSIGGAFGICHFLGKVSLIIVVSTLKSLLTPFSESMLIILWGQEFQNVTFYDMHLQWDCDIKSSVWLHEGEYQICMYWISFSIISWFMSKATLHNLLKFQLSVKEGLSFLIYIIILLIIFSNQTWVRPQQNFSH